MNTNGKKRGRPRVLTPAKQDQVIQLIGVGGSRKMAAKLVGVHVTTLADEAKRNPEFSDRLLGAEAKGYLGHIKKITESNNWRASAWFLARRYPEEFAPVHKVAQANAGGNNRPLTNEQRRKAIDSILREKRIVTGNG